jgi:hypothetical protein
MGRVAAAGLALLAAVIVAAGCGSSSGGDSSSTQAAAPPPTKAVFLKKADGICAEADLAQTAAFKKFIAKHGGAKAGQSVEKEFVLKVGLPMVQTEAEEVGALVAPKGDEQEVQKVVSAIETAVDEAEAEPERLLKGPSESPFTSVEKLARAYGFKACSAPL